MLSYKNLCRRIAAAVAALSMASAFVPAAIAAPGAAELTPGTVVADRLDSAVDTDVYSLRLPENGCLSLSLDTAGFDSMQLTLMKGGTVICTRGEDGDPLCVGLSGGDYLLRVTPGNYISGDYTLKADFTPSADWECEFNDGPKLANVIPFGSRVSGSVMARDDRDVFAVDVSESAYTSIDFSAPEADTARWQLTLYDQFNNVLFSGVRDGSGSTDSLTLNPGRYYFEVAPAVFSSAVYELKISASDDAEIVRLGGSTRIETAIEISRAGWTAGTASHAVLANAYNFPDALAGETLASTLGAPILLTAGKQFLEQEIIDEIRRLGADNVIILGGESVVSSGIATQLGSIVSSVERVSGSDRYETAIAIARKILSIKGSVSAIYFAGAKDFPDALSISPVAALTDGVILYMPATGSIPKAVADFAKSTDCRTAYVIGGKAAISTTGEKSIRNLGFKVERVGGADRYATSTLICTKFASVFTGSDIAVASGTSFPDALAGGVFASRRFIPVVLTGKTMPASVKKYAASVNPDRLYIFGGTNAVSESVAQQIAEA